MKGSRLYLAFLCVFLVLVFLVEYFAPHQFVWTPTYDKYDKDPFGCFVFDDVLSSSIDNYTVVNKTFYQIFQEDSTFSSHAFLLMENVFRFTETDIDYLYKIIHLGNQVMICTDYFPHYLEDTLHATGRRLQYGSVFYKTGFDNIVRDSIFFGTDTLNPERIFEVPPQIHPTILELGITKQDVFKPVNCDSTEILVWDNNNKPLVLRAFLGKGELFLVATPLMFTNFGILDGQNAAYAFRLLSCMKDKPLIRIEAYGTHDDKPSTPLRYILSEPPLRWAIYSIMALLILFMAFTSKRRQRIIPVVNPPPNRTLGFMQLISNLYYQNHDNIEILKMKFMYFCAEVKSHISIELHEQVPTEQDYERLVEKTGMDKDFISLLLKNIRLSIYREEVNDLQLQQYIDGMNELLKALKT